MTSYKRYENESEEELIYRICSDKEQIGTWQDVCDILNELTGNEYNESAYRKRFQIFNKMLKENQERFSDSDAQLETIRAEQTRLQKERMKLQSEKIEYNRWLRENARDELVEEHIVNAIKDFEPLSSPIPISYETSQREGLLLFGDEHFGTEFEIKGLYGEVLNAYSPEIFEERMEMLLSKVIDLVKKENLTILNVFSMGDFSDGCLRVSQLMKLRYGVVEGTVMYADYICKWLNELSKYVHIKYQMVSGNHTELRMLGQPKGTFKDDNMEIVVRSMINVRLADNPNFEFIENPTGKIFANICGYNIMGIHGEVKNMERALKDFSHIYNTHINYLVGGHLHHLRTEEIGFDCSVINVPSIIGIDDYSMSLSKTSNPGATCLIFERNLGNSIQYNIKLG